MEPQTLTKSELARELGISPQLVTKWLREGLVLAGPDGRLNRLETLQRLRLYWAPSAAWWQKPVPKRGLGTQLRALLEYDAEMFLASFSITENDL